MKQGTNEANSKSNATGTTAANATPAAETAAQSGPIGPADAYSSDDRAAAEAFASMLGRVYAFACYGYEGVDTSSLLPIPNRRTRRAIKRKIARMEKKHKERLERLWRELYDLSAKEDEKAKRDVASILGAIGANGILSFLPWVVRRIAGEMQSDPDLRKKCLKDGAFTRGGDIRLSDLLVFLMTMQGDCLSNEVFNFFKSSGSCPSTSAVVQRREMLKPEGVEYFCKRLTAVCDTIIRNLPGRKAKTKAEGKEETEGKAKGVADNFGSILAADGTAINIDRNPSDVDTFMKSPNGGKGYNQLHVTALRDSITQLFTSLVVQPARKLNEIAATVSMIKGRVFDKRTLLMGDRGFGSLNLIETVRRTKGLDCLIRVKEDWIKETRDLPLEDIDMEMTIHVITTQRKCDKERIAKGLAKYLSGISKFGKYKKCVEWFFESEVDVVFHVVRFQLGSGNWETIVTTLPAEEFSVEDIKELYFMRWNNIEKGFRILKWDNHLSQMHSRLPDSVKQEIHARIAMHNLVSCFVAMAECIEQLVEKDDCANDKAAVGAGNATAAGSENDMCKGKREPIEKHLINRRFATYITCEFLRCDGMMSIDVIGEILRHKVPVRDGRSFKRAMRPIGFIPFGYR